MDTPVVKLFNFWDIDRIRTYNLYRPPCRLHVQLCFEIHIKKQTMRILRYFSLRGLDGHHIRVYPRRSLDLVDYSEPHPYTTTDVSYRSVLFCPSSGNRTHILLIHSWDGYRREMYSSLCFALVKLQKDVARHQRIELCPMGLESIWLP